MKILVADDDRLLTHLLSARLRERGHTVVVAHDVLQATMAVMRSVPEVVLVDIMMPGGSGLDVIQRIKASMKTDSVPVIAFSSSSDPKLPETVIKLGAAAFFPKPVEVEQLLKILELLVTPSGQQSAAAPLGSGHNEKAPTGRSVV